MKPPAVLDYSPADKPRFLQPLLRTRFRRCVCYFAGTFIGVAGTILLFLRFGIWMAGLTSSWVIDVITVFGGITLLLGGAVLASSTKGVNVTLPTSRQHKE